MGLQGFHPQNEGVNFRQAFRWGLTGNYERFTEVCWEFCVVAGECMRDWGHKPAVPAQVNLGDKLQHIKNTRLKPLVSWCRRAMLVMVGRESYFRLW